MKSKEIGAILAASALSLSACTVSEPGNVIETKETYESINQDNLETTDGILKEPANVYGVFEEQEETNQAETNGASESSESADIKEETEEGVLQTAPCVYGPAEYFEEKEDLTNRETVNDTTVNETYDPAKDEVPSVYGVIEKPVTE